MQVNVYVVLGRENGNRKRGRPMAVWMYVGDMRVGDRPEVYGVESAEWKALKGSRFGCRQESFTIR